MCVAKIHHVIILHMLKNYLSKSQGKFKFKSEKSRKSQGIFGPDMAGNPDRDLAFAHSSHTHFHKIKCLLYFWIETLAVL